MFNVWPGPTLLAVAVGLMLGQLPGVPLQALADEPLVVINQVLLDGLPEVAIHLTVVDSAGLPMVDLNKDQFQLLHNARPVREFSLSPGEPDQQGVAVVVAVDTSGSMQGKGLQDAQAAGRVFLDTMTPRDRGAILSFGDTARVVQDFTDDREALNRALGGLVARGETALYDAIFQATSAAARQPLGRRAVVIMTDGEDTRSSVTLDDAIDKARESNAPVYAIGFGQITVAPLRRLASITGGAYLETPSSDQLSASIARVSELLRKYYVLRYEAPDSRQPDNDVEIILSREGQQSRQSRRFAAPPLPPLGISLPDLASAPTVRGLVELRPTLSNATRADWVHFFLDGQLLERVTEAPYSFVWDASAVPPGEHELTVRARRGERDGEQSLKLTVAPPIQIQITSPTDGQTLSGRVRLRADIDSALPLVAVDWTVGGQLVGSPGQPPYEAEWDADAAVSGEHVLIANARDERGNTVQARRAIQVPPRAPTAVPTAAATAQPAGAPVATAQPTVEPTATRPSDLASVIERAGGRVYLVAAVVMAIGLVAGLAFSRRRRPDLSQVPTQTAAAGGGARDHSTVGMRPFGPAGPDEPPFGVAGAPHRHDETTPAPHAPTPRPIGPRPDVGDRPPARGVAEPTVFADRHSVPHGRSGEPGQATLTALGLPGGDQTWQLRRDQIIGREAGPNVILVEDRKASRRHARISWEDGHWVYRDLAPTNPTLLDRRPLGPAHRLVDGDRLLVGDTEVIFHARP